MQRGGRTEQERVWRGAVQHTPSEQRDMRSACGARSIMSTCSSCGNSQQKQAKESEKKEGEDKEEDEEDEVEGKRDETKADRGRGDREWGQRKDKRKDKDHDSIRSACRRRSSDLYSSVCIESESQ